MKLWMPTTILAIGLVAVVTLGCAQPSSNQTASNETASAAPAEKAEVTPTASESAAAPEATENASAQVYTISVPGMS